MALVKSIGGLFRTDGWKNILTSLGVRGKDKRMSATAYADMLAEVTVEELYAGDDIAAKVVDFLPEEMVREWFTLSGEIDQKVNSELMSLLDEMNCRQKFQEALSWARLYGGSALLMGIQGTDADSEKPLDINNVQKLEFLTLLSRYELEPVQPINGDVTSPNFGLPDYYTLTPKIVDTANPIVNKRIHHTRLIRFDGAKLPRRLFAQNNYWSDSVLSRILNVCRNYNTAHDSMVSLLQDFSQAVYKIKDLADIVSSADGVDLINRRFEAVERCRSVINAILIGEDEEFERKTTNITGVDALLDKVGERLVAATGLPHTKLLGESPSGLGATGNSEMRDWYDYVSRQQEIILRKPLEKMIKLIFLSKKGPTNGKEPSQWQLVFNPLFQQSQTEILTERKIQAETDAIYISNAVLTPAEVTISRFGRGEYSHETIVDDPEADRGAEAEPQDEPQEPQDKKRIQKPHEQNRNIHSRYDFDVCGDCYHGVVGQRQ